jgi:hypothetical protein
MTEPGIARTARRATLRVLPALLLMVAFLSLGQSAADQSETGDDPTGAEPKAYPLGIFVTSLHDLDVTGGTFGVDYWVWSVHPPGVDPLETLEFYNAGEVEPNLILTLKRGDRILSQRKIRAVVHHHWDLTNYPFDRQVLQIVLEEGAFDTTKLVYRADTANSGYRKGIRLEGWRITDFTIEERTVDYTTTFGDPDISGGSSYARLVASVHIQRESKIGFFRLVAGVYAASALGLLSFLIVPGHPTLFSARMGLLVGGLFAAVLSMRASESVLGRAASLSLVDKIHILAVVYIFIAALIAVFAHRACEAGKEELVKRRDRIWLRVLGISFVLFNGVLIIMAAVAG